MKIAAAIALLAVLTAAGCRKSQPPAPTGGGATGQPAGGGESIAAKKTYTIAVIPKGTSHVFWQFVHAGAAKAEAELSNADAKISIKWQGPATEGDFSVQSQIVTDMVSRKVDAIVLAPLDDKALVPAVEAAAKANIPVIIFDSDIQCDKYVSFVATDNLKGGMNAGEALAGLLGGKGKVALVMYAPGSASTTHRENGFREALKKYPDIKLVDEQYGLQTVELAKGKVEDMLSKNPDLDGIFACNESTAVGAVQALKSLNKAGKIKMVGFDATPALQTALTEKSLDALVAQHPFKMGYEAVKAAVEHLNGKKVEKRIDTGVYVITRENLAKPEIQEAVSPDIKKYLK